MNGKVKIKVSLVVLVVFLRVKYIISGYYIWKYKIWNDCVIIESIRVLF